MEELVALAQSGSRDPWNKGKLAGQKAPLRLKEIWAIRIRSNSRDYVQRTTCSRVASAHLHTYRHGNMRGLSING